MRSRPDTGSTRPEFPAAANPREELTGQDLERPAPKGNGQRRHAANLLLPVPAPNRLGAVFGAGGLGGLEIDATLLEGAAAKHPFVPPRPAGGRAGDRSRPERALPVALVPGSSLRAVRGDREGVSATPVSIFLGPALDRPDNSRSLQNLDDFFVAPQNLVDKFSCRRYGDGAQVHRRGHVLAQQTRLHSGAVGLCLLAYLPRLEILTIIFNII